LVINSKVYIFADLLKQGSAFLWVKFLKVLFLLAYAGKLSKKHEKS